MLCCTYLTNVGTLYYHEDVMNFIDAAKYSMLEYHTLYPTFGAYLDHVFMVIGNGIDWNESGEMVDRFESRKLSSLPALERLAASPKRPTRNLPWWLKHPLNYTELPTNIPQRIKNLTIPSCYGFHRNYSNIGSIPDTVHPDWLNAIITYLVSVSQTPIENFSKYRMVRHASPEEKQSAVEDYRGTQEAIRQIYTDVQIRFPNHVYHNPINSIVFDPNRLDIPNQKYWPIDGSTVNQEELVTPFIDALKFAYNIRPKNVGDDVDAILATLFEQVTKTAITLGQRIVNDDLRKNLKFREVSNSIIKLSDTFPYTSNNSKPVWYDTLVEELVKKFRRLLKFSRKNKKKDIPYTGYPNGRSARAGSLEPFDRFTAKQMEYDDTDQGRDALCVIIGQSITTISEQGSRMVISAVLELFDRNPEAFGSSLDLNEDKMPPDISQRIYSILNLIEGKPLSNFFMPALS